MTVVSVRSAVGWECDAEMKNLLMIVPFFPPNAGGGVYRPLGFVKYIGLYGWRPVVVTMEAESYWITDESLLADVPADCDVRRTKTLSGQAVLSWLRASGGKRGGQVRSSRTFGTLRRLGAAALVPDTYIGWYPFAVREATRLLRERPISAIYSTSPPETSHLVAWRLHTMTGIPWVADFRDPWMNLHLLPTATPLHRRLHEMLERRVCLRASVVVAHPWHREKLLATYPSMGPVELIRNGYDPSHVESLDGIEPEKDRFQIVHAGMLTQKRTAVPLLRALRIFLDDVPCAAERCRVVLVGPRESENDAAVRELGLSSIVVFRDAVRHAETLKVEKASHILVLIKHANPVYDGIVPGKLYEYIGVRRPILALVPEGEARDIVSKLGRGEVAQQDDAAEIARKIKLMYEKYSRGTLDTDYDLSPVPEYRRDLLAGRLAERLDRLLAERI
jgi:glycosyltransferase involved in cell wall biosynthesis